MRLELAVLVLAASVLAFSVPSVWAAPAPSLICCSDSGDCPGEDVWCCDPEAVQEDPCSPERPGWCRQTCIVVEG